MNTLYLPRSLTTEVQEELGAPIRLEELEQAISSTKTGKTPGPDRYTLQYYKTLLRLLGPHMVDLFNALGADTVLPSDTLRAHISIIPKECKEPTLCSSYRPISPEH